jgi:dolichol-phosphate mannosyltransferase
LRELSVIIPCLNEAENLPSILDNLSSYVHSADIGETIVVDDSSDDNTAEVACKLASKYPELNIKVVTRPIPRKGYGAVVRFGMDHALCQYCTFVAADGVDPIQLLPKYVKDLKEGAQLVQCSRYANLGDSHTIPFTYKFYQTLFRTCQKVVLGRPLPDSTYAFKAFDREYVQKLGLTSNRFSISPEIAFKVLLSGGKIVTIPGAQGTRSRGVSKFRFRKEGPGYLKVVLRAALHRLGVRWF